MGEAAYNEAKLNGELVEQRLRALADRLIDDQEYGVEASNLLREAAVMIEWLSKERDSLIAERGTVADLIERADIDEHPANPNSHMMDYRLIAEAWEIVTGTTVHGRTAYNRTAPTGLTGESDEQA